MTQKYIAYHKTRSKQKYIEEKINVLDEFGVVITPEIVSKITRLYPREIAIENYIRQLVFNKLDGVREGN